MPDTFLTTGVSLGLLAGVVSGVCYILTNGLAWPGVDQKPRRCLKPSASQDEGVCRRCGGDTRGGVIPCICEHHQPVKFESGAWFLRQVQRAVSLMPWSLSTDKLEQIDEECEGRESPGPSDGGRRELRSVREFLEALSAKLAGGPLEGTPVASLYDHPAYVSLVERYRPQLRAALSALATALRDALSLPHIPARTGSPASVAAPSSGASGAHAQLKRLVARVVEEAASLPALARYAAEPTTPSIDSSTYEDLLATAILNKVIERYQTENGSGGRSSGIHSASASPTPSERSSPRSLNSRARNISPPLREEDELSDWEEGEGTTSDDALELPRRVPFPEFGGDIIHGTENEERDFDEVSGSDIQAVDGSWEENWLFQKKKIKTIQSVPVPMLVPNSNTEYRALIGDRDADDTTDLSDNASEVEEDSEYMSDIKKVLDSKHVIGGKTKLDDILDFEPDSLNIIDGDEFEKCSIENEKDVVDAVNNELNDNANKEYTPVKSEDSNDSILVVGVESGPLPKAEFVMKEEIHRTLLNGSVEDYAARLDAKLNGEAKDEMDNFNKGSVSTLSRHQREGEYEETVTKPVQRYADSLRRKHFEDVPQEIPTRDTDKEEDLIPGSIAYRERKKWLNYVEMPNNPYSPEAIQKRLLAKSTSSLFDMLTKNQDIDDDIDNRSIKFEVVNRKDKLNLEMPETEENLEIEHLSVNNKVMNGNRSKSPSPKILKDVLAQEVPQYKRYGRDYYIKEAKVSSGGRKKRDEFSETSSLSSVNKSASLDNFESEFTSPGLLIKQFNTIASNQQYTKFAPKTQMSVTTLPNNKTEILIEYEDVSEQTLFSAKPAYVDDDTDKKFEEILQSAYTTETDKYGPKSPLSPSSPTLDNSYVSSSSLDDSIKIYNVQTGEIVKSKPDSVSQRYEEVDGNDNIDIPDKNILEEQVSEHSDGSEESFEIIEKDSLRDERLDVISEIEEILPQLPSVKELAKKFVSMENLNEPIKTQEKPIRRLKSRENLFDPKKDKPKPVHMHSLTARSISREFREELKLSLATPLTVPGGSKEIPEGTDEVIKESSRPGSPLPEPGTIKTKLAFFESLKSKFSSK